MIGEVTDGDRQRNDTATKTPEDVGNNQMKEGFIFQKRNLFAVFGKLDVVVNSLEGKDNKRKHNVQSQSNDVYVFHCCDISEILLQKGQQKGKNKGKHARTNACNTAPCPVIVHIHYVIWQFVGQDAVKTDGNIGNEPEAEKKIILREAGRLEASLNAAKEKGLKPIVFLHYPPVYEDAHCDEIIEVLKKHDIKMVYHGHIHGSGLHRVVSEYDGITFKLVSCDCIDFTPLFIV